MQDAGRDTQFGPFNGVGERERHEVFVAVDEGGTVECFAALERDPTVEFEDIFEGEFAGELAMCAAGVEVFEGGVGGLGAE